MNYRICKKCNKNKLLTSFTKNSGCINGYSFRCKECTSLYNKQYSKVNKSVLKKEKEVYYKNNKQYFKDKNKVNYENNKDIIFQKANERKKNRLKEDINYKLTCNLRTRLSNALKRNQKSGSAIKDLGCSIEEFKIYLEKKFQEGMTWDNYGKWHIDHSIAISKFDLTNKEELKIACHYTNLQPMWALENIKKGNK